MVSNDEISQRLRNKRKGTPLNSYLVCNKCGGYYELQPGESPKDFSLECECGGHLIQSTSNSLTSYEDEYKDYGTAIAASYVLLIFGGIPGLIGGLYLITRDNERARFHGKIIIVIGLVIGLICIVYAIEALIIYNSYFNGSTTINSSSDIASVRPSIRSTR
ncbi:MAG: hypothetical protein ABFD07_15795 [Methanobacterium sp.]